MATVKEITLVDISKELPDIIPLDCKKELSEKECDIFFCALGFEERCLTIPEQLANVGLRCKKALYFEYSTNMDDNAINRPRLIHAFEKFSDSWDFLQCDTDDFTKKLRDFLSQIVKSHEKGKIILDISVCSSSLILLVMKVLIEFDINLRVVYSEAAIYHPTCEEFDKEPEKWVKEEGFGIARGVGKVISSPEYPGARRENPDLIIVFPTFKPERTNAIITSIDESLATRHSNRIIWIVGDPHMDLNIKSKRKDMMRQINKISQEAPLFEVSTFDYKKTLEALEQIYKNNNLDFHINISALGSKMQSLGIAMFGHIRPDISIYLAIPKEYNPSQYSEGCKATWQIDFGDLQNVKNILDRVGKLEIVKE